MGPEFLPFFEWCYGRFTNPRSGLARLVPIPEGERKQLKDMLTSARFVSTCSFRSLRQKDAVQVALVSAVTAEVDLSEGNFTGLPTNQT